MGHQQVRVQRTTYFHLHTPLSHLSVPAGAVGVTCTQLQFSSELLGSCKKKKKRRENASSTQHNEYQEKRLYYSPYLPDACGFVDGSNYTTKGHYRPTNKTTINSRRDSKGYRQR
ncbi:uncharacterized protein [Palaemon carinicauda]|uniref:uncharacterized protein n=1 Tax=Palaemon carinicauda TaxID=392227 RepID=UPI0035B6235C